MEWIPRHACDATITLPWPQATAPPTAAAAAHQPQTTTMKADVFSVFLLHRCVDDESTGTAGAAWQTDGPHLFHEQDIAEMYLADKLANEMVMRPAELHAFVPRAMHHYWKLHKNIYTVRSAHRYDLPLMQKLLRLLPSQQTTLVHWEWKLNRIKDVE